MSYNLKVDPDCTVSPTTEWFVPVGLYDIAQGYDWAIAKPRSTGCRQSYYMNLLVNSSLKANANDAIGRAEPNVLQITDAEIRLIDIEQQVAIGFDDLPNPFRVKAINTLSATTGRDPSIGVVVVEAIPVGYDVQLDDFVDKQILAEVTILGTTLGDVDIDFKPFSYPIRICKGCLTACLRDFPSSDKEDVYGDECADNAGADGRVCIDRSCPDAS